MMVTSLKTFSFAKDSIGYDIFTLRPGESIDIPDDKLALALIKEGYAKPMDEVVERKSVVSSPENKVIPAAQQNKRGRK